MVGRVVTGKAGWLMAGLLVVQSTAFAMDAVLPPYDFDRNRPAEDIAGRAGLYVSAIEIQGDILMGAAARAELTARYSGRTLHSSELLALRDEITERYVSVGYVTSGAVIRSLEGGVLTLEVVPGRLSAIQVESTGRFRPGFLERYLDAFGDSTLPVNVFELERRLQIFQQDPHVASVEAQLVPGTRPGESILRVRPRETRPWLVRVETSNHQSPAIGEWNGLITVDALNLSGRADDAHLGLRASEGLTEINAAYTFPLNARDTRLALFASGTDSEVVTAPFDDLDIDARTRSYGLLLSHPWQRTPVRASRLSLGIEWRESETFLLGSGFSFVEGPEEGLARVAVARGGWEWLHRGPVNVLAGRAEVSVGLDAFGATTASGDVPDGEFEKLLMQFQWARRLDAFASQLVLRADAQLTEDPLFGMEQLALGGRWTVRGYRENTVIRDNALVASLEWRIPVLRDVRGTSRLELRPFIDGSRSWNVDRSETGPRTLASAGLGLLWQQPGLGLQAEIYWGEALNDVDYPGEYSVQDDGVHARLTWSGP